VLERALFSVSELAKNIGDHGDDRKIWNPGGTGACFSDLMVRLRRFSPYVSDRSGWKARASPLRKLKNSHKSFRIFGRKQAI
jgi:hypothetical protein